MHLYPTSSRWSQPEVAVDWRDWAVTSQMDVMTSGKVHRGQARRVMLKTYGDVVDSDVVEG